MTRMILKLVQRCYGGSSMSYQAADNHCQRYSSQRSSRSKTRRTQLVVEFGMVALAIHGANLSGYGLGVRHLSRRRSTPRKECLFYVATIQAIGRWQCPRTRRRERPIQDLWYTCRGMLVTYTRGVKKVYERAGRGSLCLHAAHQSSGRISISFPPATCAWESFRQWNGLPLRREETMATLGCSRVWQAW